MNPHTPSITDENLPQALDGKVDQMLDDLSSVFESAIDDGAIDAPDGPESPLLSFVIPVKDEEHTLESLASGIRAHVPDGFCFEILFIDDGSLDSSWGVIHSLCDADPAHLRGIKFRHNAGKATSLAAGFRAARGEFIFTMDADLQDDPREISRFLDKINEGYDLVSGWKKVRRDPLSKVLPSRVFNLIASAVGGVKLHDHNCGFKCYRSEVIERLSLHGELHRVIPSLANMQGFRCAEIDVLHHPRTSGSSKYGVARFLHGICDITTTGFLRRYRQRPSHFFNAVAAIQAGLAVGVLLLASDLWVQQTGTALLLAIVLFSLSTLSCLAGLLAELVIRGPLRVHEELPIQFDTGISLRHQRQPHDCQVSLIGPSGRRESCSASP